MVRFCDSIHLSERPVRVGAKFLISATMTVRAGGNSGTASVLADTQGYFFDASGHVNWPWTGGKSAGESASRGRNPGERDD
jgi:hypothetical protein